MPSLPELLEGVSRTFALSIPRLPEPLREEVVIAYLLMRIADTFEDTSNAPFDARVEGIDAFCELMRRPESESVMRRLQAAAARVQPDNEGERAVLEHGASIVAAFTQIRPAARDVIADTCHEMARGMRLWMHRVDADGFLRVRSLTELREYCYVVAAIVGRMLTQLYLLEQPELAHLRYSLHERALAFGEGVQLVNILKDEADDALEKRAFLPPEVGREQLFTLARRDLVSASEFVELLRDAGAPSGVVAFNQITLQLCTAALVVTEARGAGAKLQRGQVQDILAAAPR